MDFDPTPATLLPVAPLYITLPSTKPSELAYVFSPALPLQPHDSPHTPPVLLVFLNGLDIPAALWQSSLRILLNKRPSGISLLAYDRFGQGLSVDRHPKDETTHDPSHGHDLVDAAVDLYELLNHVYSTEFQHSSGIETIRVTSSAELAVEHVVLIAHSLGCQLAEVFAEKYPGIISGLVLLDPSPHAEAGDLLSVLPDPKSPGILNKCLPLGVTVDGLNMARELFHKLDHNFGSIEGLSRRNPFGLSPANNEVSKKISSRSKTGQQNVETNGPLVTILRHSPITFAAQQERLTGIPKALHKAYTEPFWEAYCQRLRSITDVGKVKGPVEVGGAGHLIMVDRPDVVAEDCLDMIRRVQSSYREGRPK